MLLQFWYEIIRHYNLYHLPIKVIYQLKVEEKKVVFKNLETYCALILKDESPLR